jgi:MFS family permease
MPSRRYASAIVLRPLYKRFPEHRAKFQYAGLALSVLGILLSGFVTAPWQLLITSGLLYAIGAGSVYLPAVVLVFEWFAQKRGLAAAIVYSGTGVGGALIPIIIRSLLNRFSYKAACTSLALGYGLLGAISIHFIRERTPVQRNFRDFSQRDGSRRQPAYSFLRKRSFYAFTVCCEHVLIQMLENI